MLPAVVLTVVIRAELWLSPEKQGKAEYQILVSVYQCAVVHRINHKYQK